MALVALAAAPATALAEPPAPAPSDPAERATARSVADTTGKAKALLEVIESATDAETIKTAAADLAALRPTPVAFFRDYLARERSSSDADRRAALASIEAAVPDEQGRFKTPGRSTKKAERDGDEFDWLAGLLDEGKTGPGWSEVVADVTVIRALAASTNPEAGLAVLDFAFTEPGLIFRDECGRYLRKMSPYSLPGLIRGAEGRRGSIARYAKYQLERLDRENSDKAFADAPTDDLKIAILDAFADTLYREAVYTVLAQVDHVSPRVRAAARTAWTEYTTGRAPKKAPERKLELPGGKLTEEEEPLWLNSRELADIALRRKLEELTGEKPAAAAKLADLDRQLFDFYDQKRLEQADTEVDAALAKAEAGDIEAAVAVFDRVLVKLPDYHRRAEMAPAYFAFARQKEEAGEWRDAAIFYGKAHAVDDDGEMAKEALAKHHFARGKATQAAGGDGSAEFARAEELDLRTGAASESQWMLFAGVAGLGAALVVLFLAVSRRRSASL